MAATYVYKAEGERGKHGIFLAPQEAPRTTPTATLPDGRTIQGQYVNTNEGRHQWLFGDDILNQQGVTINYNGQNIALEDSNKSYEGANPYDGWTYRAKGDLGSGGGGGGGFPAGFAPGQAGQFGFYPAYQNFPGVTLGQYSPIQTAPYNFTDPIKFGKKYGKFARGEQVKNFDLAKDLSLETLSTELQSLFAFAPAAAALKRSETSIDNIFNQAQRTAQVNMALPGVGRDLADQADRARTYASGSLPDAQQDKALELGIRSNAADQATSGGFGATSSGARKLSDLMSAESRFKIAQYGENLLTGNIGTKAGLFLAPTQYSNAGAQIDVNPRVSAGQLIPNFINQISGYASIPASTALGSQTQQNQFTTTLEQGTRQFNASNELQNSQFNATASNQFALAEFGYNASYAGAVAGAAQTNANTEFAVSQQQQYQQILQSIMGQQQQTSQFGSIISSVLGLLGQGAGTEEGSILSQVASWVGDLFGGGGEGGEDGGFLGGIGDLLGSIFGGEGGANDSGFDIGEAVGSIFGNSESRAGEGGAYSTIAAAIGQYFGGDIGAAIGDYFGGDIGGGIESGIESGLDALGDAFGF